MAYALLTFRDGNPPASDYILKNAEPGWDSFNKIFKIGDGTTPWSSLPQIGVVSDEEIAEAVAEYLEEHPIEGDYITPAQLEAALQSHREEPTPHEAYDVDMPSFTLIFENGLI